MCFLSLPPSITVVSEKDNLFNNNNKTSNTTLHYVGNKVGNADVLPFTASVDKVFTKKGSLSTLQGLSAFSQCLYIIYICIYIAQCLFPCRKLCYSKSVCVIHFSYLHLIAKFSKWTYIKLRVTKLSSQLETKGVISVRLSFCFGCPD